MPWNLRNCTSSSENRSQLVSARVAPIVPANVGTASLINSLWVTLVGGEVVIISVLLKIVMFTRPAGVCQLLQRARGKAKVRHQRSEIRTDRRAPTSSK